MYFCIVLLKDLCFLKSYAENIKANCENFHENCKNWNLEHESFKLLYMSSKTSAKYISGGLFAWI